MNTDPGPFVPIDLEACRDDTSLMVRTVRQHLLAVGLLLRLIAAEQATDTLRGVLDYIAGKAGAAAEVLETWYAAQSGEETHP